MGVARWMGSLAVGIAPFVALALAHAAGVAEGGAAEVPAEEQAGGRVDVPTALAPLNRSWVFTRASSGLHVVDLETGQEVYGRSADRRLQPASTMKVITSAAALYHLGVDYRFVTELSTDGELGPDGVLRGNLYVVGRGDPTIDTEDLWKLVGDLKLAGVDRIQGSVVFDDSFHESGTALVGWDKEEDIEKGTTYFSTLSALSLNSNIATMGVRPGIGVGSAARLDIETPNYDYVEIDNQVTTGPAHTRWSVEVTREVLPDKTKFTFVGSVPVDKQERVTYRRTVADPTDHFVGVFHAQMRKRGIDVSARYRRGEAPLEAQPIVWRESRPLSLIIGRMNKNSSNFVAEQVLRTLGAEVKGEGSTRAGIAVLTDYLLALGVPRSDFSLVNGSGLSRDIVLKPSVLTRVLLDRDGDPEFASSLAISGTDGTLGNRLRDDPGRLRGKTGTLDGVHGLTGYLDTNAGRYAFAFLSNDYGTRTDPVKDVHDDFMRKMLQR